MGELHYFETGRFLKTEKIDPKEKFSPIPRESVDGWKKIPVKECGEKLVPVGAFSEFDNCDTSAVYFGERGEGKEMNFLGQEVNRNVSLITHFVREGVLEKLKTAQKLLPEGYYFRFLDNYRPLEVQQSLYDAQREKFRKEHPEWAGAALEEETQKYVSLPSPNKERGTKHPSPHSTGGVVDLTIIKMSVDGSAILRELNQKWVSGKLNHSVCEEEKKDIQEVLDWIESESKKKNWTEEYKNFVQKRWLSEYRYAREKAGIFKEYTSSLNMGTDFDHFGSEAGTRYFEDLAEQRELLETEKDALQNRRFLYQVMKKAGFSNYPEEWWHWSYGDNMDAANCKKESAVYGGAKMSEDNLVFESSRRGVYSQAIKDFESGKKGLFTDLLEANPKAA